MAETRNLEKQNKTKPHLQGGGGGVGVERNMKENKI